MQVSESISLQTADMEHAAHSFKACDFPAVGGPPQTEKIFSAISCELMASVEVMRLVGIYTKLVLNKCAFFSTNEWTSFSNMLLKGTGRAIRHFCR